MASKILFIGHLNESSGWSRATFANIRALVSAGYDVVCRSVKLNTSAEPPEDIRALMAKSSEGADVCFQHLLPQYLSYSGKFKKNISYFVAETLNWNASGFHHYINLIDLALFPNTEMAENAKSFIKCPIKVIPHACDPSIYERSYKPLDLGLTGYNFYFIGEFNRRKRLSAIIQAYNAEFKRTEPVNLILKVGKPGAHPQQISDEVQHLCNEIKKGLKLYRDLSNYPSEVIISSRLSDDEIMGLHTLGDCFVSASYGEAWNWGAFDAMGMDNSVIHSFTGGPKDFLKGFRKTYLITGRYESCFGAYDTFPEYNSGRESWFNCDILHMRKAMRHAYESENKRKLYLTNDGLTQSKEYSYENVGKKLREVIDG